MSEESATFRIPGRNQEQDESSRSECRESHCRKTGKSGKIRFRWIMCATSSELKIETCPTGTILMDESA
jgi:hypothetical protein